MAYDSETYGQSPFGNPNKPSDNADQSGKRAVPAQPDPNRRADQNANQNPGQDARQIARSDSSPTVPTAPQPAAKPASAASDRPSTTNTPTNAAKTGLAKASSSKRKSRAANKPAARESKKAKATAKPQAKADLDTANPAVARRFDEEDQRAYLSLLYKTGISGLVWAVLRLSRYELSDRAIAIVNTILHPLVIAAVALLAIVGLTFWLRYLLKDFAQHTQQLHAEAETPDAQNYRPTLEIVGDALEYNPKLRKNFAALFNAASILVCSLVSYLITSAVLP